MTGAGGDYNVKLSGSSLTNEPPPCLSICVGEDAVLTANVVDGTGVTYEWSTGETTESITVSPTHTTTYSVTITAGDGCTDTDEATVEVNEARWDHVNLGGNVTNCDGDCDGSIIVDANFNTTGEFRIEYTFNGEVVQVPGTFATPDDIVLDHLCAGEYTDITIIGVHTGCEAIWPEDITITEPEAPTVTATGDAAICEGEHVDLSATASGGTPPYTFTWNNGLGNGANQTVSPAVTTTYVVTVTDYNGCTDTDEVVVTVSPNPLVNISCPDDPISLRTISNSAQTCNAARVYGFWTGDLATNYTSEKAWDVVGGSFEEFSNGTAVASMQLINQDDSDLIFNMKVVFRGRTFDPPAGSPKENTQCIGDIDNSDWYYYPEIDGFMTGAGDLTGAVVKIVRRSSAFQIGTGANLNDAAAFGASGWNDLEVLSQPNSGPHLNDGAGGDYNVNLSGATLQNTNADCLTLCEGESTTLTANVVEGTGVSFEWSTGETTASITVMPNTTTTYSVTITAGSGCTDEDEVTVTVNPNPEVEVTGTDATCGDDNGTATANASGGTAPYTYEWSNGGTTETITDLGPGTYSVTVTDANGCTAEGSVTIENIGGPKANAGADQEICEGEVAMLMATASGGTPPYSFQWNQGLGSGPNQEVMPNVTTNYRVTVTDANGCTDTDMVRVIVNPNPTVSVDDVEICAGDDATLTAVPGGGTPGYTFEWSTGATTASITVSPGSTTSYSVTVTDSKGCTASASGTVTVNPNPAVSVDDIEICAGDSGTLTAMPSGGTPGYTFEWSTGATSASITVSPGATTSYSVTVTDAKGCTASASGTVTVNPNPMVSVSGEDSTCGDANGSATATPSGGEAPYSFLWSTDATTATINGLLAGTYSVTVTDANGCTATGSVTIDNIGGPTVEAGPDLEKCPEDALPIDATVSGGTPPYTFAWTATGGSFVDATVEDPVYNMMMPGTYTLTLTVTDANGCEASDQLDVTVNPSPSVTVEDIEICAGDDGTLTAVGSGGTPGYTFEWSTGATTASITVSPGSTTSYSVTITDSKGCSASTSGTVTVNPNPTVSVDDEEICAGDDATLTADASGGTPGYTYEWSTGATTASITVSPGATTNYSVTVTDSKGCTASASGTVTVNPNPMVSVSGEDATCGDANGSATATPSGGEAPYSFLWSTDATTAIISGLVAGTYSVTVTDANGCTATGSVTIDNIGGPTVEAGPDLEKCPEDALPIDATVSGGTPPYTYAWTATGGSFVDATVEDPVYNMMMLGTYTLTLTVTDANGCEASDQLDVTVNPSPSVTVEDIEICAGDAGTLTAVASSGTPGYTFEWSTGATTASITVSPGSTTSYSVTITDSKGCSASTSGTVTVNPNPTVSVDDEEICAGDDATLTAVGSGGTPGYTYEWSTGATTASITVSPGSTTSYSVTVTDSKGCTASTSATVTVNPNPIVSAEGEDATCGDDNGSATASATGGMAPYTFAWSNGNAGATITGLAPGTYTVTATDSKGCSGTASVTISNIGGPTVEAGPDLEKCPEDALPIDASVSGGTPPYTYAWTATGGSFVDATVEDPVYNMMMPGTYTLTLTVTDANGCEASDQLDVTVNPSPVVTVEDIEICAGDDGTLTAVGSGGTPGYTFEWSTGATTASITVSPGSTTSYSVTITDSKGCSASTSGTVTVNPNPTVSVDDEEICAGDDATLTAVGSGGTPGYTYEWSTGATTASITVSPGSTTSYSVTVTDSKGCTASTSATVTVNPNPIVSAEGEDATCGDDNGSATASASGGMAPYTFAWSNGDAGATITGLAPGTYTVTATDSKGCSGTASVTISNIGGPEVDAGDDDEICAGESVTLTATTTGGTDPISITWMPGNLSGATITVSPASTTTYTATATDANGCVDMDEVVVTVNPNPSVSVEDIEICAGDDGTLTAVASGGTPGYTFEWSTGATTASITVSPGSTTSYSVTVTDSKGCMASTSGTVTVNPNPVITSIDSDDPNCESTNGSATANVSGGTPPYSFAWSNGGNTATIMNLAPGTYDVTVTDVNGCMDTGSVTIADGLCADIDIEKATNGQDADDAPGVIILVPNTPPTVTWTYVVTNTGPLDLINVNVNDDQEGFIGTIPFLASGDSFTFTRMGTAQLGQYTNNSTVVGTPVDENGDPTGDPDVEDEDPSNYVGVFINIDKEADRDEICAGEEVNFSLTLRLLGGVEGIQLRNISVTDSNLPNDLIPYDAFFDPASDLNGNGFVDFIDNNNDGVSDEEFVWNYTLSYDETTTNEAEDMAEVWYVDPVTMDEFFVGNAMNMDAVTVTVNQDLCASLGDFVWEDLDADGIQDAGEPGIENVTVMLLDGDGNMLDQTTTDNTGFYQFTELIPGDYIVKFTAPGGFDPSPANQGGDDTVDSDADETTGQTGIIELEQGENDPTNDAGFYQPASLGDFVWLDEDADGIQDAGEPGIENVTVMLLDGDGNMLDQTTTDATGFYEFTDLVPGDYIVKFTAPAGFNPSPANQGGDDTVDSDADETTGESPVVTLESGENNPTIDAGFFGNAGLGDFVWEDLDADGIQDAGEPGIENVTVMLLDGDGNMLD
ncbi:MAG: SdrD B-like domain-containing protein, partial [Bacteroidota bacterium]